MNAILSNLQRESRTPGRNPLCAAAMNGHVKVVGLLLTAPDIKVNEVGFCFYRTRSSGGYMTPLCIAVAEGHVEVVRLLLAVSDVQVNAPLSYRQGDTPLHLAAQKGHFEVVELLLGVKDIQINAKRKDGATPLMLAIENNRHDIVTLLLSAMRSQGSKTESLCSRGMDEKEPANERQKIPSNLDNSNDDKDVVEMSLGETNSLLPSNDVQGNATESSKGKREADENEEKDESEEKSINKKQNTSSIGFLKPKKRSLQEDPVISLGKVILSSKK